MTLKQVSTKPSHLFSHNFSSHLPPKMFLSFSSFQVWRRGENLIETTQLVTNRLFTAGNPVAARSIHKPIMIREEEREEMALKSLLVEDEGTSWSLRLAVGVALVPVGALVTLTVDNTGRQMEKIIPYS